MGRQYYFAQIPKSSSDRELSISGPDASMIQITVLSGGMASVALCFVSVLLPRIPEPGQPCPR